MVVQKKDLELGGTHPICATMSAPSYPLFLEYHGETGSPTGVPTFSNPKSMQLILGKGGLGVGPTETSLVTLLKNHSIKGLFLHEAEEIQR